MLEAAGLWDRIAPHGAALRIMRIVDAGGDRPEPRIVKDFDAAEIGDEPFGWNFPNWLLRRETVARLGLLPNVAFRPGIGTRAVFTRAGEARVTLSDGGQVSARLLVAADGRASPVREAVGIGVRTIRYGQKALAFAVTHPIPHDNVSTEIHRSGGPSRWCRCPIGRACPPRPWCGWNGGPRPCDSRAFRYRSSNGKCSPVPRASSAP